MRDLKHLAEGATALRPRRIKGPSPWGSVYNFVKAGRFLVASIIDREDMVVIATAGEDWEHVSISREKRAPHWAEMEQCKRTFFKDDETAMQLHVPPADHINTHPNVLHLWRPVQAEIPRPPEAYV